MWGGGWGMWRESSGVGFRNPASVLSCLVLSDCLLFSCRFFEGVARVLHWSLSTLRFSIYHDTTGATRTTHARKVPFWTYLRAKAKNVEMRWSWGEHLGTLLGK